MDKKTEIERMAVLETQNANLTTKVNGIENSINSLHGKFDMFAKTISENFVAKETLHQYMKVQEEKDKTQVEKDKNKMLDRVLWMTIATVFTGLIAFFLREFKV